MLIRNSIIIFRLGCDDVGHRCLSSCGALRTTKPCGFTGVPELGFSHLQRPQSDQNFIGGPMLLPRHGSEAEYGTSF